MEPERDQILRMHGFTYKERAGPYAFMRHLCVKYWPCLSTIDSDVKIGSGDSMASLGSSRCTAASFMGILGGLIGSVESRCRGQMKRSKYSVGLRSIARFTRRGILLNGKQGK